LATGIYGIIGAQNEDNAGETLYLDGVDESRLFLARDEHENDDFFHKIGGVTRTKKIYKEEDCEDAKQIRCWQFAQVPFLYGEGVLADDEGHPNAISTAALLKFSQREDVPLEMGFSIDGAILERKDHAGNITEDKETGKHLTKTVALAAALTVKPCNPKCKVFLENDLHKSVRTAQIPMAVLEAVRAESAKRSFTEKMGNDWALFCKLEKLKKSLDNYFTAFTGIKCQQCGTPVRFFKSSDNLPNSCSKCGSSFSLAALWGSLNK